MWHLRLIVIVLVMVTIPSGILVGAQEIILGVTAKPKELNEIYNSDGGSLTFNYPGHWEISIQTADYSSDLMATISSTDRVLHANSESDFEPNDVQIVLVSWHQAQLNAIDIHTSEALLRWIMSLDAGSVTPGEIEMTQIGNLSAVSMYTHPDGHQEGIVLAFQLHEQVYITISLHTALGELEQWLPTALAMAESLRYSG